MLRGNGMPVPQISRGANKLAPLEEALLGSAAGQPREPNRYQSTRWRGNAVAGERKGMPVMVFGPGADQTAGGTAVASLSETLSSF